MGRSLGTILSIAVAVFAPYAAAALGLTGFGATAFGFLAQGLVGKLVGGSSLFGGGKKGAGGGTDDQGLLVNKQSTRNQMYVIYGERKIGGHRVYVETTDANGAQSGAAGDRYLNLGLALCEGEIGWINSFTFQDRIAWIHPEILENTGTDPEGADYNPYYASAYEEDNDLSHADWVADYNTTTGVADHFDGLLRLALYRGTTAQTLDTPWFDSAYEADNNNDVEDWAPDEIVTMDGSDSFDGKGVAWALLNLKYDREKFPGAPTVQFDVVGKRVYDLIDTDSDLDPFDDKTLARNDTYDNVHADRAIYKNPSNALYDYLTNSVYGKGLSESTLSGFDFAALRTYCENKKIEVNGAINTDRTVFDNTQTLLNSANAFIVYSQGKYAPKPLAELVFNSNTFVFNKDNIIGEWKIALGSKKNKQNRAKINFFNPEQNWQSDIITFPEEDTTNPYLAEDNDVLNERSVDLPLTSVKSQAEKIGKFLLKQSRYQDVVTFKSIWQSLQLDIGDPVYITHDVPGYNNAKFRVVGLTLQQDATVDVTLISYPVEQTIDAGDFIVGFDYKIKTVGDTDFTAIGASDNTVGTVFTATGVGSGTGTADEFLWIPDA